MSKQIVTTPESILNNKYVTIEDAINDVVSFYYERYSTVLTIDDIYFCIERVVKRELSYVLQSLKKEKNVPVVDNTLSIFIDEDGIKIYYFIDNNGSINVAQFNRIDKRRIHNMISKLSEYISLTIDYKLLMPEAYKIFSQRIAVGSIEKVTDKNVFVLIKNGEYTLNGIMPSPEQVPIEKIYYKPPYQMYFYINKIIKTDKVPILSLSRRSKSLITYLLLRFSKEEQQQYIKRWTVKPRIMTILRYPNPNNKSMKSIVWSNLFLKSTTVKTVSKLLNKESIRIKFFS